jgi:hypothetical protein
MKRRCGREPVHDVLGLCGASAEGHLEDEALTVLGLPVGREGPRRGREFPVRVVGIAVCGERDDGGIGGSAPAARARIGAGSARVGAARNEDEKKAGQG